MDVQSRLELTQDDRAAGTSTAGLLPRCSHQHRPDLPPTPDGTAPIAVTLSGGGFRATLTGLGVLRFLADSGLLARVRCVSSVSGGGIANAMFARCHDDLATAGFAATALDDLVVRPVMAEISSSSLSGELIRNAWRLIGPATRTDLLARAFDRRWLDGTRLDSLSSDCRFIFSSANLTTGARFVFTNEAIGDYIIGHTSVTGSGLRLSEAVASSAAVPGAFAAYTPKGVAYPCGPEYPPPKLVDGGVYDNVGIDAIDDHQEAFLVVCNAGGVYLPKAVSGLPIVRDLQRSNSSLYKQSTAVRSRTLVERFQAHEDWAKDPKRSPKPPDWARRGILFGLGTDIDPGPGWAEPADPDWVDLVGIKTSFAQFPEERCERLVRRGWWLTGASLNRWHPDMVPIPPTWRPL